MGEDAIGPFYIRVRVGTPFSFPIYNGFVLGAPEVFHERPLTEGSHDCYGLYVVRSLLIRHCLLFAGGVPVSDVEVLSIHTESRRNSSSVRAQC